MPIVEFCGEEFEVVPGAPFFIGRDADLSVDDNPYLHRHFLCISQLDTIWMLSNVGRQLTATVADVDGRVEAYVAPGASIPLVFATTNVRFTAGPTAYELSVRVDQAPFTSPVVHHHLDGDATVGAAQLTPDQKRLVVALCEPVLLGDGRASVAVPSLATVAARLGWSSTKLNRKLDNVCQKLSKLGVRGLHGGPDRLASNRRSRLVEYALAVRLVTRDDLALLDVAIDSESDHIP